MSHTVSGHVLVPLILHLSFFFPASPSPLSLPTFPSLSLSLSSSLLPWCPSSLALAGILLTKSFFARSGKLGFLPSLKHTSIHRVRYEHALTCGELVLYILAICIHVATEYVFFSN